MASKTIFSHPVKFCLHLIGAWPKSLHVISQRIVWTVIMGTCLTFQLWYCVSYIKSAQLPDLLDGLSVTLSNTVTFSKLIIIWFNYRILCTILTVILEDWDNNDLTTQNKQLMMDKAVVSSRIAYFLIGIYSLTCILYSATTMLMPDNTNDELPSNQKKLLLKMRLPFEVTMSPIYEIIIIAQFAFEFSVAFIASMLMAFFAALVLHVGTQIDIICQQLKEICNHDEEETFRALKYLITKHQRIIYLAEYIKNLFTYISLIQFLANILVICFLGFIIVNSLNTEDGPTILAKCFPYYVAINCEAFVLCYTGEYLTSKSENISEAAYHMFWYKLRPRESRIVLLLLVRAQEPLSLTAGKFVNLSLETFANMLKASASYVSILLAMY